LIDIESHLHLKYVIHPRRKVHLCKRVVCFLRSRRNVLTLFSAVCPMLYDALVSRCHRRAHERKYHCGPEGCDVTRSAFSSRHVLIICFIYT